MANVPKFIDTKTIIVNLLKADKKTFLSIDRLQELLNYIYIELQRQHKLQEYQILFDIYFDAIERTVYYNGNLFVLDINDEKIYLRDLSVLDSKTHPCQLDETLYSIVNNFVLAKPLEAV